MKNKITFKEILEHINEGLKYGVYELDINKGTFKVTATGKEPIRIQHSAVGGQKRVYIYMDGNTRSISLPKLILYKAGQLTEKNWLSRIVKHKNGEYTDCSVDNLLAVKRRLVKKNGKKVDARIQDKEKAVTKATLNEGFSDKDLSEYIRRASNREVMTEFHSIRTFKNLINAMFLVDNERKEKYMKKLKTLEEKYEKEQDSVFVDLHLMRVVLTLSKRFAEYASSDIVDEIQKLTGMSKSTIKNIFLSPASATGVTSERMLNSVLDIYNMYGEEEILMMYLDLAGIYEVKKHISQNASKSKPKDLKIIDINYWAVIGDRTLQHIRVDERSMFSWDTAQLIEDEVNKARKEGKEGTLAVGSEKIGYFVFRQNNDREYYTRLSDIGEVRPDKKSL